MMIEIVNLYHHLLCNYQHIFLTWIKNCSLKKIAGAILMYFWLYLITQHNFPLYKTKLFKVIAKDLSRLEWLLEMSFCLTGFSGERWGGANIWGPEDRAVQLRVLPKHNSDGATLHWGRKDWNLLHGLHRLAVVQGQDWVQGGRWWGPSWELNIYFNQF